MVRRMNHSFTPKTVGSSDRLQEASLHVCDQKNDYVLYFRQTKPARHTEVWLSFMNLHFHKNKLYFIKTIAFLHVLGIFALGFVFLFVLFFKNYF